MRTSARLVGRSSLSCSHGPTRVRLRDCEGDIRICRDPRGWTTCVIPPRVRPCPTAAFRALPGLDHDLDGANDVPVKVLKILGRGPVLEDSLPAS